MLITCRPGCKCEHHHSFSHSPLNNEIHWSQQPFEFNPRKMPSGEKKNNFLCYPFLPFPSAQFIFTFIYHNKNHRENIHIQKTAKWKNFQHQMKINKINCYRKLFSFSLFWTKSQEKKLFCSQSHKVGILYTLQNEN